MKILVFDLDGTLFDTRQDIANAVNHARRHFGLPELTLQQVTKMVGHGITVLAQKAFEGCRVDLAEARDIIFSYYKLHPTDTATLYPGVRETIPKLAFTRTIISNKPKSLVEALLEQHGIGKYFDFVAGGDTFAARKPDPCAIHFLLDRYQVSTSDLAVIGDHEPDILMAKEASVKSVFCRYGFFGVDSVGADYAIDSFPQLEKILAEIFRAGS